MMQATAFVQRLVDEYGYPEDGALVVLDKLVAAAPEIQAAFRTWLLTGALPELQVAGFAAEQLTRDHGLNPIATLLTLDWLLREPERAARTLRRGRDLVKPGGPIGRAADRLRTEA